MGEKRYYWLKLKEDFFKQLPIKKLRKVAGGDTFTIIYLKMMLLSMNNDGIIAYDYPEEEFIENLALDIDEDEDNVAITVRFLIHNGLMVAVDGGDKLLTEVADLVGSEAASAARVRKHRASKALQCNNNVTSVKQLGNKNVTLDIDIEKDIDKDIYISPKTPQKTSKKKFTNGLDDPNKTVRTDNVALTEAEYQKLTAKLGSEEAVQECMEILGNYKGSCNKVYASDYYAINSWVVKRYREEHKLLLKGEEDKEANTAWDSVATALRDEKWEQVSTLAKKAFNQAGGKWSVQSDGLPATKKAFIAAYKSLKED